VVVVLLGWPPLWRELRAADPRTLAVFSGIGVVVALHWLTFYGAIKLSNASVAASCMAVGPLFLAVIEPLIARRPFDPREIVVGLIALPGVALVVGGTPAGMHLGLAVGVLSAFLVAIFASLNKRYVEQGSPLLVTGVELAAGTAFLTIVAVAWQGQGPWHAVPGPRDAWLLAALSLGCTLLPFALALRALRHTSAFMAQLAVSLEPVYAILLAIVLFVKEQIGGSVLRRRLLGNQYFSKRVRTRTEMEVLVARGGCSAICELQGSLFFGTTNQLLTALELDLQSRRYLIFDLHRVQTIDVTAAHMLEQVKDILAERDGCLILAHIPQKLPSGRDIRQYLDEVGLVGTDGAVRVFGEIDEALEWVEDRVLEEAAIESATETVLSLNEIDVFRNRNAETLAELEQRMQKRSLKAGEKVFELGDSGDELFLIRKGAVRILLPISETQTHHLGTFGRGSFFGEMAFLDGATRSANAVAFVDTELYALSRQTFEAFSEEHKNTSLALLAGLASVLSSRLRFTNSELRALEG
jgi:drug/metabolite transporter (DMT)-like permease/anti-anti-sigma regulatory factor